MQSKSLIEFLLHLSGYHMTSRWKAATTRPEEGKERLRLWHVESDEKDKNQVTRFLESLHNMNQRKLFSLGYKLRFLLDCSTQNYPGRCTAKYVRWSGAGPMMRHRCAGNIL
jgi:hypothetical protein